MILRLALVLMVLAGAAFARAPDNSLRPLLRTDVFPPALPTFAPDRSLRPHLRTRGAMALAARITRTPVVAPVRTRARSAPLRSLRPALRSRAFEARVRRQKRAGQPVLAGVPKPRAAPRSATATRPGPVCRDRALIGTEVGAVPGRLSGCGIRGGAVRLYTVAGIDLSSPAVMECDTARALKSWVDRGMHRSVRRYGGGVVQMRVAAGYSCRTRNGRKGAKISEHGKGRAIDIAAFRLRNGDTISVLDDWGRGRKGRILKDMHRRACGPFGTVLGPDADRYHKDHFHFDIARHRSGPYCR